MPTLNSYVFGNEFTEIYSNYQIFRRFFLLLGLTQFLYVDGVLHLETLQDRWLVILLTGTKLLNDTCFLELSLKLLESSLNVLTIFYWYNNHCFFGFKI